MVLKADGPARADYVVLPGRSRRSPTSRRSCCSTQPDLVDLNQAGKASGSARPLPAREPLRREADLARQAARPVNLATGPRTSRDTSCTVLRDVDEQRPDHAEHLGRHRLPRTASHRCRAARTSLPGPDSSSARSRAATRRPAASSWSRTPGCATRCRTTATAGEGKSGIGLRTAKKAKEARRRRTSQAQTRLGYENVKPRPVPAAWSQFLPTGPRLSTDSAKQPQGS